MFQQPRTSVARLAVLILTLLVIIALDSGQMSDRFGLGSVVFSSLLRCVSTWDRQAG